MDRKNRKINKPHKNEKIDKSVVHVDTRKQTAFRAGAVVQYQPRRSSVTQVEWEIMGGVLVSRVRGNVGFTDGAYSMG